MNRRDFLEKTGMIGTTLAAGAFIIDSKIAGSRFTVHDELIFNIDGIEHSLICAWDHKLKRVIVLIDDKYINTPIQYQLQRKNKEGKNEEHNPDSNVLSAIDAEYNAGLSQESSGIQ